jgi:hypothetical protein
MAKSALLFTSAIAEKSSEITSGAASNTVIS